MYSHTTQLRVRYGETDQMQVLYYGFYAWYYEVGRVEALRNLGVVYKELEEQGTLLVVGQLISKFIKSAHYDELLTIKSTVPSMPRMGLLLFETEIMNEAGELIHKGEVKLISVDKKTRTKKSLPNHLLDALRPYFE